MIEPDAEPRPRASTSPDAPLVSVGAAHITKLRPLVLRFADGRQDPARVALPGYSPTLRDEVLTTRGDDGAVWIIGVVAQTPLLDSALLDRAPGDVDDASQKVHDREGRLLFEYDPVGHRAVLHAPDGDLLLRVPLGQLKLEARDGVTIESPEAISLESQREVLLGAANPAQGSSMRVAPGEVSLLGSMIHVAGKCAELAVTEARIVADEFESKTRRSKIVSEVIETRAGRIVERARDSYREVERLAQVRATTVRFAARRAVQVVGEQLLLKARETAKIKGERIHLA